MKEYHQIWQQTRSRLPWECLFVSPFWLETVVNHLGAVGDPLVLTIACEEDVVGIFPFCVQGRNAFFLGIPDVCDYQDVILAHGYETGAMEQALTYLTNIGINRLDLQTLRPDAILLKALESSMISGRAAISRQPIDVTYEVSLPKHWDDYLMQLNGKQRHEIRRKIRRLEAHGSYQFRMADTGGNIDGAVDQFLRLFHLNRKDKSRFMDDTMGGYFRSLIGQLSRKKMLRLYFLDVEAQPVAAVLCFDYRGTRYLYNSAYDAAYRELSVGILSKIFSIQKGMEEECRRYDFLKGEEIYKKRIGGQERTLYRYEILF